MSGSKRYPIIFLKLSTISVSNPSSLIRSVIQDFFMYNINLSLSHIKVSSAKALKHKVSFIFSVSSSFQSVSKNCSSSSRPEIIEAKKEIEPFNWATMALLHRDLSRIQKRDTNENET